MNRVTLAGRLTRDPEVRVTNSSNQGQQLKVARYTLAVDRVRRKEGENNADFISCVAFGKTAEFVEKHLRKGMKMIVFGRIQTGSYTKQDGTRVFTTDVVVEGHEFAESRNAANGSSQGYSNQGYNNQGYNNGQYASNGGQQYQQPNPAGSWARSNPAQNTGGFGQGQQNNGFNQFGSFGQGAADDGGFMSIPNGVDDEGLPFN